MSMRDRLPASASDSVDLAATLELLASLTQYAEAGAVQPHTLAQAAQHALEEHGDNVEVLVAVGKLYLATGERTEAGRVLGRAASVAPEDRRVAQLLADAGLESGRGSPASPKPKSFMQRTPTGRVIGGDPSPAPPESARSRAMPVTPHRESTLRSMRVLATGVKNDGTAAKASDTIAPSTPRSSATPDGPTLRPTVRMARVSASPERSRWGKQPDARDAADARADARAERDAPPSDGPRSTRGRYQPVATPTSLRSPRDAAVASRAARAATGNLKLLDPNDERRHLDRYELIGEIASGGMASVFLARSAGVAGFQRFFAIKRLHPHLADEQEFIDMFLDEARLAAGIHHPNVVPILEVGTTDAGYYLVMDYIEGDTLSGVINRGVAAGGLPRPIALRIVLDSLHGLHAAHELTDSDGHPVDLVHRDCSPQNILVGIDGSSRLTDFGVARASSRLSTTRSATVKGKLAYLSPEQATGRGLDRRSDLFGMGVILWEVLAGRRLFRADSDGATLSRILVEPIPLLTEYASDIPDGLAHAVAMALARDPQDRFETAADMADAIEQAVRDVSDPELHVASPRDVAAYMRELFGADIAARRDAVRAWTVQGGDNAAQSGPRSQGSRNAAGASPAPPPSTRTPVPASDPEPISSGSEPPSSKTEPSAVHSEEEPAHVTPPVIETVTAGADRETVNALGSAGGATAEAGSGAADREAASGADPTAPAAASPLAAASEAKKITRRKGPPALLIAITAILVMVAIAVYVLRAHAR